MLKNISSIVKRGVFVLGIVVGLLLINSKHTLIKASSVGAIKFAVIGDFGKAGSEESAVANLVKSWSPDFIITTGDNNYENGDASTIDANIGQYYHDYIYPYKGTYGSGASTNKFFPSLGNHDWKTTNAQPYIDYFGLPGNERYYDFVKGSVHFFVIDSDTHEPDGISPTGTQGLWLKNKLSTSSSTWKVVYFHHAPYSSSTNHGSYTPMRWPFKEWGADVVLSGHDHTYERLNVDGVTYFVNGAGGASLYALGTPISGSEFSYNAQHGAMLVEADSQTMSFKFYNKSNVLIDSYSKSKILPTPTAAPSSFIASDIDRNGTVNIVDIGILINNYGKSPITNPRADVNLDGVVDIIDIGILIDNFTI